ncbi:MAG: Fis family two component sigma-54 specific transcriptional regulator [Candidatus Magnetoglobus multicellularis str. Araruama]|uniref:Fis family two component sigma-54 specific transcriptional regulator n=1 Tax=Candidatus Magnetoglobus multicellularis str. Araruama TaxID=890399 RepID=A0A1V1P6V7_9BACT|nr:MAG: Fis family two component sigma-54 specific transcriptional regulator [Candidatus Magnetoglobus multicellularis str. Araruama]
MINPIHPINWIRPKQNHKQRKKMSLAIKIICIDKGRELAAQVKRVFTEDRIELSFSRNLDAVVDRFERGTFDVMLFSDVMASQDPSDAMEILELISIKCPKTQILYFAHPKKLKTAHKALRAGVYHYSVLPVSDQEMKLLIETAYAKQSLVGLNMMLRSDKEQNTFESMIGQSTVMQNVYQQIRQAAAIDIPVLLSGETGTGKELAAQAIHELSPRSQASCIPVHIGSLPDDLVASELFGHERGAFTGATSKRKGCFENADGGTVFLDEIATIDEKMQVSLLRLLETSEFNPIGSQESISVNVRIIAASNADLLEEIRLGRFREDLYYRLDVMQINLPPLRDRHGDLHLLVDHFINYSCENFQKTIRGASTEFMNCLDTYPWPGNVRELKNVIQRSVINSSSDVLELDDLPEQIIHNKNKNMSMNIQVGMSLDAVEKELIIRTMEYANHNRTKTSQILGISRRALYNKFKRHGIQFKMSVTKID